MAAGLAELRTTPAVGTVEVRIRHQDAEQGATLGWFSIDGLQRVHDLLMRWGLYDEDGTVYANGGEGSISGQFNVREGEAWFEFVLTPSEP
jgi:hypothetical protein